MEKKLYLVIVDYTHGGFGFGVYANSKEDLKSFLEVGGPLGGRGISIVDENIENHPLVVGLGEKLNIYNIDEPEGLLVETQKV